MSIYQRLDNEYREANSRKLRQFNKGCYPTMPSIEKDPAMRILFLVHKFLRNRLPSIIANVIINEMLLGCSMERFQEYAYNFNKYLFRFSNWHYTEESCDPLDRFLALEYNNLQNVVVVLQCNRLKREEIFVPNIHISRRNKLLEAGKNYLMFTNLQHLEIWNAAKCFQRDVDIKELGILNQKLTGVFVNLTEVKMWYTFYHVALTTIEELSLYNLYIDKPHKFCGWGRMKKLKKLMLINVYDLQYNHLEELGDLDNLQHLTMYNCQNIKDLEKLKSNTIEVLHWDEQREVVDYWENKKILTMTIFKNLPKLKILKAQGYCTGEYIQDVSSTTVHEGENNIFMDAYKFMDKQRYALHVDEVMGYMKIYTRTEALNKQYLLKQKNIHFRVVFIDPRYKVYTKCCIQKGLGKRSYYIGFPLDRIDECLLGHQISKKRKSHTLLKYHKCDGVRHRSNKM